MKRGTVFATVFIVFGLLSGFLASRYFLTPTPMVNGSSEGLTLYKGDFYRYKSSTAATYVRISYGGHEVSADSGWGLKNYFLNQWLTVESGVGRVYIREGDKVFLDQLYTVETITNDYVVLRK